MSDKQDKAITKTTDILSNKEFLRHKGEAIDRLTSGKTPMKEIKNRPGRGGTTQKYVDITYMVEQANLITSYNWKQEVIKEEEFRDKNGKILEVGVLVRVTFYNTDGTAVSKEQWGQKDIVYDKTTGNPVAYFDDKKAAISDGTKKCLSYFGIAADVYAGKDLEFYMEDEDFVANMGNDEWQTVFNKLVKDSGIKWPKVFEVLKVKSLGEVEDFREAYEQLKYYFEKEDEA